MLKYARLTVLCFVLAPHLILAGGKNYVYKLDLSQASNHKLLIELNPPQIEATEITFRLPKIVPGTYEIYDFGRFVSDFKAVDDQGKDMPVMHTDVNSWKISNANHLAKISYRVEDTWDTKQGAPIVFEPGGTNIEEGKNFVFNNHGFFGYFDGMKKLGYELDITHPEGFYGSTSLIDVQTTGNTDIYKIPDYVKLVDSPIMYCKPDTTTVQVGGASILVSSYSPNQLVHSSYIAENIKQILSAQKEYLGGKLPIKKYAFIFYFCSKPTLSGNSGALEHNLSSFYVLPETQEQNLKQVLRDVAAHEFFHVVTPLSIHSEEIADFDFNVPKMSEHLWLYEGMTEYSAGLVQVKYGIIDLNTYVGMIHDKLVAAAKFKDNLSFTEMSKHVVEKGYHDQYNNVYQKGALIGMCLDIKLRKLSGGKYGIQEMLHDLSGIYGPDKAFKDSELFEVIVKLTYPEIGDFFKKYVEGTQPLPYKELLHDVGIEYSETQKSKGITLGSFDLGYDPDAKHFVVAGTDGLDKFGKKMGYKKGDQILKIGDSDFTIETAQEVITKFISNVKPGDEMKMTVLRKGLFGKTKEKVLKAKMIEIESTEHQVLDVVPDAQLSPEQKQLRKAWVNE